jgi:nucleoside 2-deoxyribosyltransferase
MTEPKPGSPVYCAGPMFSAADLWQQEAIADVLEKAGYETFLPQRDGIEAAEVISYLNDPILSTTQGQEIMLIIRKAIFALDMFQVLERCQSLVFNMDGRVPDEGSVAETSAAFIAGKPIVILRTTPITLLAGQDNPMIEGLSSTWSYTKSARGIAAAMRVAVDKAEAMKNARPSNWVKGFPPQVKAVVEYGEKVWDFRKANPSVGESIEEALTWLNKLEEIPPWF